jgi:plasmid maintenance system antidote protein VapI
LGTAPPTLADEKGGYKVTRQVISNYITGKRKVPTAFVVRLGEVLDLSQDENVDLAWAFAYGQG